MRPSLLSQCNTEITPARTVALGGCVCSLRIVLPRSDRVARFRIPLTFTCASETPCGVDTARGPCGAGRVAVARAARAAWAPWGGPGAATRPEVGGHSCAGNQWEKTATVCDLDFLTNYKLHVICGTANKQMRNENGASIQYRISCTKWLSICCTVMCFDALLRTMSSGWSLVSSIRLELLVPVQPTAASTTVLASRTQQPQSLRPPAAGSRPVAPAGTRCNGRERGGDSCRRPLRP